VSFLVAITFVAGSSFSFPRYTAIVLRLPYWLAGQVVGKLLVKRLKLDLPPQAPPRITAPVEQPASAATQPV
jgi:hypothetical protein